jgi:AraC-like DNA-binding protein
MTTDGHQSLLFPPVCLYRFDDPTTFDKAATFGVTLGVVLQGEKRVRVDERELVVDASNLLVITLEREINVATRPSPGGPYLGLGVCFGPERVAKALVALSEAGGATTPETSDAFMLPVDPGIASALERLLAALGDPLDAKLLAPLVVDELLYRLLRSDAAAAMRGGAGRPGDAKRILEAMQFIRAHHAEKITVGALAKRVAMSPSHFAHRFTAVARMSPMRYLRQARLDRAHALLLESGARVSEVALEVGFESPAHFTREYKRRFGVAPSKAYAAVGLR